MYIYMRQTYLALILIVIAILPALGATDPGQADLPKTGKIYLVTANDSLREHHAPSLQIA